MTPPRPGGSIIRSRLAALISASALAAAGALATITLEPAQASSPVQEAAAGSSVHFTAAGDFGSSATASGVLAGMGAAAPDFDLALGDLSYGPDGGEQAWCDLVHSQVGTTPFELISGNHESDGLNGQIENFAACLPNKLPGLVGTYGREWYVDVPAADPVMRIIMISPNLTFPGQSTWQYTVGSSHYTWTANAIDGAHASGIPWVVVGMHEPCLAMTAANCSSGPDLNNLMVSKKVDLVLSGHVHMYARTKQLANSTACPKIVPNTSSAACIRDSDGNMTQGGTVFATVGTGGEDEQTPNPSDPEAPYFASYSASKAWGFLNVTADAGTLSASFDRTSGAALSDSFTIQRDVVDGPPTAAFTSTCTLLACSFNGTGSTDPGGGIASYAWTFGDGGTATGATPSHTYQAAGTYSVSLTVTDSSGQTDTVSHQVQVTAGGGGGGPGVAFVGAHSVSGGAVKSEQVAVPAGAEAGDLLVVLFSGTGTWTGPTGVTGMTSRGTFTINANTSSAWTKVLTAADLGKTVRMDTADFHKGVLDAAVYSGADASQLSVAHTSDTGRSVHVGPVITAVDGSLVVSYWSDKSDGTTSWTAPAGVTVRDTAFGTGGGRYASLLADSNGGVPGGIYGPLTATANGGSGSSAHAWTIDLPAASDGGGSSGPPTAAFTSTCTDLACDFDGSGSSDLGGSITSYAWTFGDGGTATGATPAHTYQAAGTYSVSLTVTDNTGQTDTVSHQVPVTDGSTDSNVSFVGAHSISGGAVKSEQVPVPAGAQAGDVLVVFFASTGAWTGPTGVTGLTSLGTFTTNANTSTAWTKVLTAADLGKTVRMDATTYHKGVLDVAVYSGVNAAAMVAAHGSDTSRAAHTAPAATAPAGAWVLTYWTDKSDATTSWTAPAAVTSRDTVAGTGAGRYSSLVVDSGGPVAAGAYGPLTATANSTSSSAHAWTVTLPAA